MDLHLEKCMRIIGDLISFCHAEGSEEFQINMTHSKVDGVSAITVSCPLEGIEEETLDFLKKQLNLPRQREVEQDFWELSGEGEMSEELTLVGMMINEAEVGYRDGILNIHVLREN